MTMNLSTKILVSTIAIASLFVGGTYALQSITEKKVIASTEQELANSAADETSEVVEVNTDEMTINEYYIGYLGFNPKIIDLFSEKYGQESLNIIMLEMFTDEHTEKFNYLNALHQLYDNGEQPIITKNEIKEKNEEGNLEVVLNAQGEYSYSLETQLRDVNALSSEIDSTKAIKEICKKYGVNPNGKIKDLTPEIIIEIDQKLFDISDHPKD